MPAQTIAVPKRSPQTKPAKPRRDYPLFPHANGQWAKKVRGKMHYFGGWDDPQTAEAKWDRDKHALLDGRDPDDSAGGDSIRWLCNVWMDSNQSRMDRGEMSQRCVDDYHATAKHVASYFGAHRSLDSLRATDFEAYRNSLPANWAPTTVNSHLRRVRVLFSYGNNIEATERPFAYKLGLKDVPRSKVRKHQSTQPRKEFTRDEIHLLLSKASVPMKAYILLAINCGFGPADIGRLERSRIDLENRWIGEPRGKTGIERGAYLWEETVDAVRAAMDKRVPTVKPELDKLAFLTIQRRPVFVDARGSSQPIVLAFGKLKVACGIEKSGIGIYSLRHVCATQGADAGDQQAMDYIMGHCDPSMQANYREGINPERVIAVCNHIRDWLFG